MHGRCGVSRPGRAWHGGAWQTRQDVARLGEARQAMQSKNKAQPTRLEREHIARIKSQPCVVCGAAPPSEAHEIEQGLWFLSLPLCEDCHRGGHNGIHGQRRIWNALKLTEISALNETLRRLF